SILRILQFKRGCFSSLPPADIPSTTVLATSPPATTTVATTTEAVHRKNYKNKIHRQPVDDLSASSNKILGAGESSELWNIDGSIDKDRDHRYRDNAASFNEDQREKEAFVDNEASSRAGQPHRATVAVLLIFICYTLVASSLARR
uniref:Uncharacterized protein n=1 Tax=Anopheles atroparvus TaxID=41427 RepID=A0AAG5DD24_ANOAO